MVAAPLHPFADSAPSGTAEARTAGAALRPSGRRAELPSWMGVQGFIDIHCHLLPQLDDGPPTVEAARQLAAAAYHAGTLAVIATPHRSFRFQLENGERSERLRRIETQLPEGLAVFPGCELEISDESLRAVRREPRRFTLNGSRYLLIELMRGIVPPNFEHVLGGLFDLGLVPILAHPERHLQLNLKPQRLSEWVERGCLAQVTAASLCGRFGRRIADAAWRMLQAGLVQFVASDAHDIVKRPPDLQAAYGRVASVFGPPRAAAFFTYNPLAVLRDEPLG